MYSKLDSIGKLCGFLIVRVGDILYTGTFGFLDLAKKTVSQFRAVEVEVPTHGKGVTFNGLDIHEGPGGCMISPQGKYANELPLMDISRYVNHDALGNEGELKSTFRQGVGLLIRARQTRPDVGF